MAGNIAKLGYPFTVNLQSLREHTENGVCTILHSVVGVRVHSQLRRLLFLLSFLLGGCCCYGCFRRRCCRFCGGKITTLL